MAKTVFSNNEAVSVKDGMIEVLSSGIGKKIDTYSRIVNATLVLDGITASDFNVWTKSNNVNWEVIDYITLAADGKIYLNITEEVGDIIRNDKEKVFIRLGNEGQNISFTINELHIEYIPERIMHESNAYYDVSAGKAGNGKINLATGGLNFIHNDSTASGINHIYNSWQADKTFSYIDHSNGKQILGEHNCGKGWKLNLHQYLVKLKGESGQDLYTYVDGSGNYHEFTEKYYYPVDKQKNYVDKAAVNMGFDGKLTYTDGLEKIHEIKTELKTTSGLTLSAELTDFKGIEKLELRSEDRAQLENEVEDLKFYINDLEKTKEITKKSKELLIVSNDIRQIQTQIEGKSIELEQANINLQNNITQLQNDSKTLQDELRAAINNYYAEAEARHDMFDGAYNTLWKKQKKDVDEINEKKLEDLIKKISVINLMFMLSKEERQKKIDDLWDEYYEEINIQDAKNLYDFQSNEIRREDFAFQKINNEKQSKIEGKQNEIEKKMRNLEQGVAFNLRETINNLRERCNSLNNDYASADLILQISRLEQEFDKIENEYKKAEKILPLKQFQLNQLKAQEPTRFLTNNSGDILAFNETGILIAIADAYENVTYINYEDGKIVSVTDTDNNITKLEYESSLLARIIDKNEKVIRFEYYNDTLSKIAYPDGTSSEYYYIGEFNFLQSAVNPAGYGIKFEYDYKKVVKVNEFTNTYEISNEGWLGTDNEETRLLANITYAHLSSTLTDRLNNNKTYIFDILGKPVTVYEGVYEDPGENTKSVSMDYNGNCKAFSISDNINYGNLLENVIAASDTLDGTAAQSRIKIYNVDISKIPEGATDLVLSAWAKADSAFIFSERKTDYSSSKIDSEHIENSDTYKKNRKFELRAELTYDDGTTKPYSASFDWLNTDWQYLALPVTIKEEDETGDRLTGKFPFVLSGENRKLVSMAIILDYSYNTNNVEFDCVTLRQGKWEYSEFGKSGKKTYGEDAGGNKSRYNYDENGNLTKVTVTDKQYRTFINTYEYNKQKQLVRSTDYNGLCEETVYDEKGRAVKSVTYNISDPASKLYSESVHNEKGKIIADIDITGEFNSAEYEFDHTGAINVVKDAMGNKTAYGYGKTEELVSVSASENGEENSNTLEYTLGYTTRVSSGGTDYTYTYDGWGRQKEIKVAGDNYSSIEYVDDNTTVVTLGNGEKFISVTDKYGNIIETDFTENIYDEETGLLTHSIDKSGERVYTSFYTYDNENRLTYKIEDGAGTLEQEIEYNGNSSVKNSRYTINDLEILDYSYEYDNTPGQRLNKIILPGGAEQSLEYDGLGRTTGISINGKFTKDIYYAKYGDHATNYVSSVWYGLNGKRDENTKYAYDKKGNITSIRENGNETVRYTYDSLNRLLREDNALLDKTEIIEYDNNGNILAKTKYGYTLSETLTDGIPTKYGYSACGWKDKLYSYNGEAINKYDSLGNPWKYRNKELKWAKGRNLIEYNGETYNYNASGIRTGKTAGDIETTYYLDGNKIIAQERRNKETGSLKDALYYRYGADGITGFEHNNTEYVYRKNIQGDITHIYTTEGTEVVKYIYDAWGNHNTYAESGYEELAKLNPFRYRSYYWDSHYDAETGKDNGFYYLNSRYYDPQVGRFINADDISYLEPKSINGLNLFAYCLNNPVMYTDSTGHGWWSDFWKGVGSALAIIGGIALCFVPGAQAIGAGLIITGAGGLIGGAIGAATGYGFSAGWDIGTLIGGSIGLMIAAPQLLSLTANLVIPTGLALTTTGAFVITTTAIAVPVGALAVGAGAIGLTVLFASNNRPGNNQKQNEQFRNIMKKLGIDRTDWRWEKSHRSIKGKNFGYKALEEFIRKLLGL